MKETNNSNKNNILFLSEAYNDSFEYYKRSLYDSKLPTWDYVVLTASNSHQAKIYRKQIDLRKEFLPSNTKYLVVSDRNDKRVGSGGATLSVLKEIRDREKSFDNLKILIIHSGGDSKRIPQYSVLGKIFSPIPHKLNGFRTSSLFDELLISVSSIPGRIKEGTLVLSGDVLLLFNALKIEFNSTGATAISFKEDVNTGKNHGVYLGNESGYVTRFLHKQTISKLREVGAVDEHELVNIDTGAVLFGKDVIESLWSLISNCEVFDEKKYNNLVNDTVRLSLYGDFLYPLATESNEIDYYKEQAEGELNKELTSARNLVWHCLHKHRMKLMLFNDAKFVHLGTSEELIKLVCDEIDAYKELGWKKRVNSSMKTGSGNNSILVDNDNNYNKQFYLENSYVHENVIIGNRCIISNIEIMPGTILPDDIVLHCLKQINGKYICRIFGISDNPKEKKVFGKDIPDALWEYNLYPECDTMGEALNNALDIYNLVNSNNIDEIKKWNNKKSLRSSFENADVDTLLDWNSIMSQLVQINKLEESIDSNIPVSELDNILSNPLTEAQKEWFINRLATVDFKKRLRLHYYLGKMINNEAEIINTFSTISDTILKMTVNDLKKEDLIINKNKVDINLPLRVNFGGGWTDTPPYCNENGGVVINAAIELNGKRPVRVTVKRLEKSIVILESKDVEEFQEFTEIEPLQEMGNPLDPFALHKAALLACGVIPVSGGVLNDLLSQIGGGIYINTEVIGVPKGSGLGTSSILAAACVKALFEFFGKKYNDTEIYDCVLAIEQLMSTGGGWQDQVGGVSDGIKIISSKPGLKQVLNVKHLDIDDNAFEELNKRFALIYTGQRRLARNLLRDVVGRYIGNEKETLFALNEIKSVAYDMENELVKGNLDAFGGLMSRHWELSKMIDRGSSNKLIDQIFNTIDDLIDGKMICGAGGGGFLQVLLKENVNKTLLKQRLRESFPNSDIDVWDCKITRRKNSVKRN